MTIAPASDLHQDPAADPAALPGSKAASNVTLAFLLRRMRHKSDFPALSDSMASVQRLSTSENESLGHLAEAILKDVALTNKLLRVVNTAHYRRAGADTISTVSRAISLVGFAGIRNLAMSLVLVEHMEDKHHANQLKEEFLRAVTAGTLADELCKVSRDTEEAFIGALLRNLGRLLTEFYLPEEAVLVRELLQPVNPPAGPLPSETEASMSVMGISYESLGQGVGRTWGLPETLLRCMSPPHGSPPSKSLDDDPDRLRWLASVANEAADALFFMQPDQAAERLRLLAMRYGRALGFGPQDILDAAARSRQRLTDLTQGLQLKLVPGSMAERLLDTYYVDAPNAGAPVSTTELGALDALVPREEVDAAVALDAVSVLTAGIQDITNTMVENFQLSEILRMILETMYRALGFGRVVFCLRDAKSGALLGRFGLGEGTQQVVPHFQISLKPDASGQLDLLSAVCQKGVDTLIADASVPNIAARLPTWLRDKVKPPTFLLLPLVMKQPQGARVIGMIYADKAEAGSIALSEKELSLLRTLRNQAVMAFRQAG